MGDAKSGPFRLSFNPQLRDDELVAQGLQAPRHPFTLRGGLEQDPRPRPRAEDVGESRGLRADPLFDQLAGFGEDAELAFLLLDVPANMVHGWPLLLRP